MRRSPSKRIAGADGTEKVVILTQVGHFYFGAVGQYYFGGNIQAVPIGQVGTKAWTRALKRAGIENFRWHDLRHTFATWHRQADTPTHELQRLGGWKTGQMVERYAHVAPEALQGAANRLDAFGSNVLATPKGKRGQHYCANPMM